jgi:hypothetical protein
MRLYSLAAWRVGVSIGSVQYMSAAFTLIISLRISVQFPPESADLLRLLPARPPLILALESIQRFRTAVAGSRCRQALIAHGWLSVHPLSLKAGASRRTAGS